MKQKQSYRLGVSVTWLVRTGMYPFAVILQHRYLVCFPFVFAFSGTFSDDITNNLAEFTESIHTLFFYRGRSNFTKLCCPFVVLFAV